MSPTPTEVILNVPPIVNIGNANIECFLSTISSEIEEEKDLSCTDNDDNQQSTINVVNSNDVIIGSVTQFHGPVTIVQQLPPQNSKKIIEERKYQANLVTTDCTTSPKKTSPTCLPNRFLIIFTAITVIVTIVVLGVISSIDTDYSGDEDNLDDIDASNKSLGNISGHEFYTVSQWGGRNPLWQDPITTPIAYVIVSHTASSQCQSFADCSLLLRNIQAYHISESSAPNVGYNFLIGGDGNIYEGRGWYARNFHRDRTIGISFLGNYIYDELTDTMINAFDKLLEFGVEHNILPSTYQIVAHNHTIPTLSPGRNVYKVIKNYTNFYPDVLPSAKTDF